MSIVLRHTTSQDFKDISSEEWRQYIFLSAGGAIHKEVINSPAYLAVSANGHRILDSDGISHYIPSGWVSLSWKSKEGFPHFVF